MISSNNVLLTPGITLVLMIFMLLYFPICHFGVTNNEYICYYKFLYKMPKVWLALFFGYNGQGFQGMQFQK